MFPIYYLLFPILLMIELLNVTSRVNQYLQYLHFFPEKGQYYTHMAFSISTLLQTLLRISTFPCFNPPSNSSFYSYYWRFVTRPCEHAVTKLAQCRTRVKPWRTRALFLSFTRVRSQPMASDLSCVTLLPRPDRTGKLIAKVKRNKGATPSESLKSQQSARRRKRDGKGGLMGMRERETR